MRYRTQAIVALLLLWGCTCASGQDLKLFGTLGKLEPVSSWDSGKAKSVVLVYRNRGVVFQSYAGSIMVAAVFAPASSRSVGSHAMRASDLVPGVGARGVMLGASMDQVKQSPFIIGAKLEADQADGAMYRGDRNEILMVRITGDSVSQLDIMGAFRTPEGVTDRSTIPEIEKAYGRADQYYQITDARNPLALLIVMPVLLALGLGFGLLAGIIIRGRMQDDSGSGALVHAMVIAGAGLAAYSLLFGFVFLRSMGMPVDWKIVPVNMVSAGITGAICVLIMKVLKSRMTGCLGALVILFSMELVSLVVTLLTTGTGPVTFDARGMLGGILYLPFVIGLFVTGRPKTRS